MEEVFDMKVQEKLQKLKDIEADVSSVDQCNRIAGNFRMVEMFVYFVLWSIIRRLKLTKISLHNNYVLRHYAELSEYLNSTKY